MSNLDIRQLAADRLTEDLERAQKTGDYVAVARLAKEAVTLTTQKLGPSHIDVAHFRCELGNALLRLGQWDEADEQLEQAERIVSTALGPKAQALAEILFLRGDTAARQEQYDAAASHLRRAISLMDHAAAPGDVMIARGSLATVLRASGDEDGAEAELNQVIELAEQSDEPLLLARALAERAEWEMQRQHFAAAEKALARSAALHKEHGEAPLAAAQVYSLLGEVLEARAAFADAASCYQTARELFSLELSEDHPQLGVAALNVATAQRQAGLDAHPAARDALRIFVTHFGPAHPHTERAITAVRSLFGEEQTIAWMASISV